MCVKNYHIYTENMFMEIYHMYIYIHIYIQDNIQKKNEGCHGKKQSFPTSTNSGRNQSIDSFVKLIKSTLRCHQTGFTGNFPI